LYRSGLFSHFLPGAGFVMHISWSSLANLSSAHTNALAQSTRCLLQSSCVLTNTTDRLGKSTIRQHHDYLSSVTRPGEGYGHASRISYNRARLDSVDEYSRHPWLGRLGIPAPWRTASARQHYRKKCRLLPLFSVSCSSFLSPFKADSKRLAAHCWQTQSMSSRAASGLSHMEGRHGSRGSA